jgi:hypothetical protein
VSVETLLPHAVTLLVRTPGEPDVYGDPVDDVEEVATRAELQQVGTREEDGDAVLVSTWRIFLPADAPARGWDALRLDDGSLLGLPDGALFELRGDPARVVNPRLASAHHLEAYAEAVF